MENSTGMTTMNGTLSSLCNNSSCITSTTTSFPVVDPLKQVLDSLQYVNFVLLPTFLILGLTGNTLTIIIMNTKRYNRLTSGLILMALAISDTCLLLTQPFNKMFVMKVIGYDARALSEVGCKLFFVFFKSGKMTSSWFIVFLCFERFVAVWFPLKAKFVCTRRNTFIGIACVYTVIVGYNCAWSIHSLILDGVCFPDVYNKSVKAEVNLYRDMLTAGSTLYSLAPLCIMCVLTPLIIVKLASHRRRRKQMTTSKQGTDTEAVKTTAMLLGVVGAYILLIIPITTLHNLAFYMGLKAFGNNSNGFLIFRDVSQILEQLNYSINFWMYVVTSKQFREGLSELLKIDVCLNKLKWDRRSNTSSTTKTSDMSKSEKKQASSNENNQPESTNGSNGNDDVFQKDIPETEQSEEVNKV